MHFINTQKYLYTAIKKISLLQSSEHTLRPFITNEYTNKLQTYKCLPIINNLLVRFFVQHLHIIFVYFVPPESKDNILFVYHSCVRHFWFYICLRFYNVHIRIPNFLTFNTLWIYLLLPVSIISNKCTRDIHLNRMNVSGVNRQYVFYSYRSLAISRFPLFFLKTRMVDVVFNTCVYKMFSFIFLFVLKLRSVDLRLLIVFFCLSISKE